jgi:hypothetical protein
MALKTNFTDDILAESMNGKRQYNVTENSNGTKSLEDATDYQSVGSTFSAKDMNETNAAVNQAYDDMGDEFNPEVDYAVGDYTIRNNKVWKFTTAHPAGAWDESHVKATKILSEARELTEKMDADKIIIGTSLINFNSGIGYLPYNHYPEYEKEPICIAMMVGKQRYGMTVVPSNYKDGRIELYTNAAINGNLYVSYFIGLRK